MGQRQPCRFFSLSLLLFARVFFSQPLLFPSRSQNKNETPPVVHSSFAAAWIWVKQVKSITHFFLLLVLCDTANFGINRIPSKYSANTADINK